MIGTIYQFLKTQINHDKLNKLNIFSESSTKNSQTKIIMCIIEFLNKYSDIAEPSVNLQKCLDRINIVYDLSYDLIHTGEYHCVPQIYRDVFAWSSIIKCTLMLTEHDCDIDHLKQSIFVIDMAKLMGTRLTQADGTDLLEVTVNLLTKQLGIVTQKPFASNPPTKKLKLDYCVDVEGENCDIDVIDSPALDYFWNSYYTPQRPALLTNTINHWPALKKWQDMDYLIRLAGERTVPIELGKHYVHENWSQKLLKFEDFVKNYILTEDSTSTVGYLAQHELFDQIPELKNDICIPEYCCKQSSSPRLKAWLGPKGTVSPLHTDPTHNLLSQVFGSKLVILADPASTSNLYAHDHFVLNNTSQVDAEQLDFEKFPLSKAVTFKHVILRAGQVLYIPPGWWHYVKSMSPSFSVSFWFD